MSTDLSEKTYCERRDALVRRALSRGWIVVEAGKSGVILRRGRLFAKRDAVIFVLCQAALILAATDALAGSTSAFFLSCAVAARYLALLAAGYLLFLGWRFLLKRPEAKLISRKRIEADELILDL